MDDTLPRIIYFQSLQDCGDSNAQCPHCGAKGRYIYWFICEDGQRRGAMSGCVKHFPWHRFAHEHKRILDKSRTKKKLTSWDDEMVKAIEAFADGSIDERTADSRIRLAKKRRESWMKRRRW